MNSRIEAIKKRLALATSGPWIVETDVGANWMIGDFLAGHDLDGHDYYVTIATDHIRASELKSDGAKSDAEFIAHARMDIPYLLDYIEKHCDQSKANNMGKPQGR